MKHFSKINNICTRLFELLHRSEVEACITLLDLKDAKDRVIVVAAPVEQGEEPVDHRVQLLPVLVDVEPSSQTGGSKVE